VAPDGKSAYVTNEFAGAVSQYDIDPLSGKLSPKAPASVAAGFNPIGIAVRGANRPPDCSGVAATPSVLSPADHKFRLVSLSGATDPDGDALILTITSVTQDEPLNSLGDGDSSPDAKAGTQSNNIFLRAERSARGDGRVYRVSFTGSDGKGGSCSGTVAVGVPQDTGVGKNPVDSAPPSFDSFGP
jgi:hypothetical protein